MFAKLCIAYTRALENGVVVPTIYLIQWIFDYHVNLSDKGYRSLIYSGDHDISIPFLDTQAWIRALNYSIVDDWRQWHTDDQVAGYSHNYS
ncbi:putative peptidase S10, serine carboxypeptidase, alpha/Beta hydrolase [Medicago truncatula]|uniref:Putative peptidase S10, serine carboxypeptidase, alpha/Beta hydrolase n=1 Tax=Medicago truncatula TaxID=3880 RepID=A0A396J2J3_MEDTR|nr:putative peptidase S10, serine carboxypeptidase, alpha/Beta hydrolase [Medicago truncatula]